MSSFREVAAALREEARTTDERRLLVLAGGREPCYRAAREALDAAALDPDATTLIGLRDALSIERLPPARAGELLGTTRDGVVLDCHDACRPNALGRAAGTVDGGGLLVLLAPPLDVWPDRRDRFDEGLAVPPFDVQDVTGNFRRRLVTMLRAHSGIAVVDADTGTIERDGLTYPAPRRPPSQPRPPAEYAFPIEVYEACLTTDQVQAVRALEALWEPGNAIVVEADRGRGKSSAAGLAAGGLAAAGQDVLVTAPAYQNSREVFARAEDLLSELDVSTAANDRQVLEANDSGRIRFSLPPTAADLPADPDAVIVDEAAALPVRVLERFLDAPAVAFTTTVHGYEGAGRGFSVRFRDRLTASGLAVTDVSMAEPIRYAAGDPVEVWAFRALLLDARPAVAPLVEGVVPEDTHYARLDPATLRDDEHRLREAFGLLVLAHYRTEPDDLARLLDAPNVAVRALIAEDRIVSVALLAREGGLSRERSDAIYRGERVKGNMLPDVLLSQLRDPDAGITIGVRVMRIATHPAVRSRGLGSKLLKAIRGEFDRDDESDGSRATPEPGWDEAADWLGVGYGATPELLRFWQENGYGAIHLSTTRNEASGEYSALMLDPLTDAGRALHDRSARWFLRRIGSVLADPLDDVAPDVVRETLRTVDPPHAVELDLTDREWRVVASAAFGPGLFDVAPRPFRRLALRHLVEHEADLDPGEERLLVRKALQGRPWPAVAEDMAFASTRECKRTFGRACRPLVETYGTQAAREEADHYR